jgi:hypothetical protein
VFAIGSVKPDGHAVNGCEVIAATFGRLRPGRPFQEKAQKFPTTVGLLTSGRALGIALQP